MAEKSFAEKFHQTEPSHLYDDLETISYDNREVSALQNIGDNEKNETQNARINVKPNMPMLQPKPYDGKTNPVIWLNHYEIIADANLWDSDLKLRRVIGCLDGAARIWYQNQILMKTVTDWENFKLLLKENFSNKLNELFFTKTMFDLTQSKDFNEYFEEKFGLIKLTKPNTSDNDMIAYMLEGMEGDLKNEVMDKLITNPCSTIDEFKNLLKRICDVKRYQQMNKKKDQDNYTKIDIKQVDNNVETYVIKQSKDIQRIFDNLKDIRRLILKGFNRFNGEESGTGVEWDAIKCFKCGQYGHIARQCKGNKD